MSHTKRIHLRFDIDTISCIEEGLSNLLALFRQYDISATFYVNIGKSIDRKHILTTLFSNKKKALHPIHKLSPREKLGNKDFLRTILLNPNLIKLADNRLQLLLNHGHSIGLHGGVNHATWQYQAHSWSNEKIFQEIQASKLILEDHIEKKLTAFSSPGWNSPQNIHEILAQLNFKYIADTAINGQYPAKTDSHGVIEIPTNYFGSPGNIGYLEYIYAKNNRNINQSISEIKNISFDDITVIYDHPCFAGKTGFAIMEALINSLKNQNFTFVTEDQVYEN